WSGSGPVPRPLGLSGGPGELLDEEFARRVACTHTSGSGAQVVRHVVFETSDGARPWTEMRTSRRPKHQYGKSRRVCGAGWSQGISRAHGVTAASTPSCTS